MKAITFLCFFSCLSMSLLLNRPAIGADAGFYEPLNKSKPTKEDPFRNAIFDSNTDYKRDVYKIIKSDNSHRLQSFFSAIRRYQLPEPR